MVAITVTCMALFTMPVTTVVATAFTSMPSLSTVPSRTFSVAAFASMTTTVSTVAAGT